MKAEASRIIAALRLSSIAFGLHRLSPVSPSGHPLMHILGSSGLVMYSY